MSSAGVTDGSGAIAGIWNAPVQAPFGNLPPGQSMIGQITQHPMPTGSGQFGPFQWSAPFTSSLFPSSVGVGGGACGDPNSFLFVNTAEAPIAITDIDGDGLMDQVTVTQVATAAGTFVDDTCCVDPSNCTPCCSSPNQLGDMTAYFSVHSTVMAPNGSTTPFGVLSPNAVPRPSVLIPDAIASIANIDHWPGLPGDTQTAFYEDMNGDGLADLIFVQPSRYPHTIGYLPGLGTGAVGFCPNGAAHCTNNDRLNPDNVISMANAPGIPIERVASVYAHDVNGDGLADLITAVDTVSVYLNLDGKSFGPRTQLEVRGYDPSSSKIMFADMNGSGVDDIVCVTNNEVVYVDLLSGQRPGLLRTIRNGRGATTTLEYASTVDLARCSRQASSGCTGPMDGKAWQSETPQVMHVVTRTTTTNNLPAPVAVNAVTEYSYSDPVYDGRDRMFRGFRRVRQRKSGNPVDADDPPVTTETTYLVGRCEEDYPNGQCPEFAISRPFTAVAGLPVNVDTYDDQGHYSSTVHTTYGLTTVADGVDQRISRFAYAVETDTYVYDSSAVATRSTHKTVDNIVFPPGAGFARPATGTITIHGAGIHGGGRDKPALLVVTTVEDENGNVTHRTDWGRRGVDLPIASHTTWTEPAGDPTGWMWKASAMHLNPSTQPGVSDVPRDITLSYDASGHPTDVYGVVTGTGALHRYNTAGKKIAPIPQSSTEGEPVLLVHTDYTPFGLPKLTYGAQGTRCRETTYDDGFQQLPTQRKAYVGAFCSGAAITTNQQYDRGFEQVTLSTAPNGAMSNVEFEAFGRRSKIWKPDPITGALPSPSSPSIQMDYIDSDTSPQLTHTQEFDGTAYRDTWSYEDGLSNHLLTAAVADLTAGDGGAWVVSGQRLSAKGRAIGSYLPFFWGQMGTPGSAYPLQQGFPSTSTRFTFDAFGHAVDKYDMSGALVQHRVNRGLALDVYDGEEIAGGRHDGAYVTVSTDGHGRTASILKRERLQGQWIGVVTSKSYTAAGQVAVITQSNGAQSVTRTAQYDSLGHMVANIEPNTSISSPVLRLGWSYVYDDSGRMVGTSDARGCGENIVYDALGRVVSEDFSPCVGGQQDYSEPGEGDGTEAYFVYDDGDPLPSGHLKEVFDRGADTQYGYDFRNRPTTTTRYVARPGLTSATLTNRYASHPYTKATGYDDMDRPVSEGTGADTDLPGLLGTGGTSEVDTFYSARGTVSAINSSYGFLVSAATYDADRLPFTRTYGDSTGTTTTVDYDNARRPNQVQTKRTAPTTWTGGPTQVADLQELTLNYDVVGNPLTVQDESDPNQWALGAAPRHLTKIDYDDAYRVTSVKVAFSPGSVDQWVSPNNAEELAKDPSVLPITGPGTRIQNQTFAYDWLGNTQSSTDDEGVFFDRSIGAITNNPPSAHGPNQLMSASLSGSYGGQANAAYDLAGNLVDLVVARSASCPAP
ncbi:MAG TPA: toxin TcdB middle/N-terminal domain-containing protein, partial [Chloroflexota bacterium]|nr:toxin TcdB middle/N-terminal domain-containing protein [Chloroflexota bacterium]